MVKKTKISSKGETGRDSSRYGYQGNDRPRYGYSPYLNENYGDVAVDDEKRESKPKEESVLEEKFSQLLAQIAGRLNQTPGQETATKTSEEEKSDETESKSAEEEEKSSDEEKKSDDVAREPQQEVNTAQAAPHSDEMKTSLVGISIQSPAVLAKKVNTPEDKPIQITSEEAKGDAAVAATPEAEAESPEAKAPVEEGEARITDMSDPAMDGGPARAKSKDEALRELERKHIESVSGKKASAGGAGIGKLGKNQKQKEDAGTKLAKTQGAVEEKQTDKVAETNAQQVQTVDAVTPPEASGDEAKQTLNASLQSSMPETVEDVDDFKDNRVASKIGDEVKKTIESKTQEVSGTFETLDKTPKPAEPAKAVPFAPIEKEAPTAPLNLGKNLVPKVEEKSIDLTSYVEESDNLLAKEGIKQEHLDLATFGDLAEAKQIQGDIEKTSTEAPAQLRKEEKELHAQSEAELKSDEAKEKAKMQKERDTHLAGARGQQVGTKASLEDKKKEVTDHINKIYEDTNAKVQEKLENLKTNSMKAFDQAEAAASTAFESNVRTKMDKFKEARYSGADGLLKKGYDWLMGMDEIPEVKRIFEEEKALFIVKIDSAISRIISDSERVIDECKSLISKARTEIDEYVKGLGPELKKIGEDAQKDIQKKLDELDEKVNKAAADLKDALQKKRAEAIANIDKKIEAMKEEMSGFLSQMGDLLTDAALKFFKWALEAAGHSADEIMSIINKGKAVITAIVNDPMQFLSNLANAVGTGVKGFGNNIMKHLGEGFMTWLTGQLSSLPIQLPEKFDLKGIFSLTLQVLGLTYANLRTKLSDKVGEDKVAVAEKSVEVVMEVKDKGPIAMYDMMAEKADSIKTEFVEGAKEWAIGTMIKQGLIRLATMINPAGALVQAVLGIYNGVIFLVNNWDRILDFVNSIFDSIAAIASGAISSAATFIENTMAKTIPLILDFIAQQLNLSGIAERITKIIHRIRKPIDEVIDKVINFITEKVKKIAGKILGKDKDKKKGGKPDEQDDHKESKEQTAKDFDKDKGDDKTTDVDRKEHKKYVSEIKAELEEKEGKADNFDKFIAIKKQKSKELEEAYSAKVKEGINVNINLLKIDTEKKDVLFKISIAPNNTEDNADGVFANYISKPPFKLKGGWENVKNIDNVKIQLGTKSLTPHLYAKHGPGVPDSQLISSVESDLEKVKSRIPGKIEKLKKEIETLNERLIERKNEIDKVQEVVNNGTATEKQKQWLADKIKALNRLEGDLITFKANLSKLEDPKEQTLSYYEEAKRIVDLKVIEFSASKFTDEMAMKNMVEKTINDNQAKIDSTLENKKPGERVEIDNPLSDTDLIYVKGITFGEDLKIIQITKFSKVFAILYSAEPEQEEGRFIINTAYPK